MGKEDYVSLEVAKLLKEKGFDEECEYYISANTSQVFNKGRLKPFKEEGHEVFLCPTLYEAQKWLREKHNIFVVVFPHYSRKYETIEYEYMIATFFDLLDKPYRHKWEKSKEYYEKYQECLNSGIEEALKLI